MNKREADLTPKVVERLQKRYPHRNWALEVKMKGNKVSPHQQKALDQVENGKFTYKLPDMGRINPFDVIHLGDADAIVCVIQENLKDVHCEVNGGVMKYDFRL